MKTLPLTQIIPSPLSSTKTTGKGPVADTGFADVMQKSLESVNTTMQQANAMGQGLVTGEHSNIHETMIAMEKSTISFRMLTRMQQKALQAYQDIMRMQV